MTEAGQPSADGSARGHAAPRGVRATLARCFAASVFLHAGLFGMSSIWPASVDFAAGEGFGAGDGAGDGELFTIRVRGTSADAEADTDGDAHDLASRATSGDAESTESAATSSAAVDAVAIESPPEDVVAAPAMESQLESPTAPTSDAESAALVHPVQELGPPADARVVGVGGAPPSDAETIAELAHRAAEPSVAETRAADTRAAEARAADARAELAHAGGSSSTPGSTPADSRAGAAVGSGSPAGGGDATAGGGGGASTSGTEAGPARGASAGTGGTPGAGGLSQGSRISSPAPLYPVASRRLGEQGSVTCVLHVASDGRVARVEIARSSGYVRLDRAAVAALERWRFQPSAAPFTFAHTVRFELE